MEESHMRMLKRLMLLMAIGFCLLLSSQVAVAQTSGSSVSPETAARHEANADETGPLIPPLSGEGSQQTYMEAIWVIVIFVILLAILYPTAWKSVLAGLKAREERIRHDIADAETTRAKAEATLGEYNKQLATAEAKVGQILSQAATEAERIASSIRMHAQQEAEEIKERAIKDIDASRKQAMAEIYEQTANLSTAIAEKILRRNLNADDQRELVNQSLKQMQTLNA
jgi:F-type H+-transporting ATPase subunit b